MILSLTIKDFALVEYMEISFQSGLVVFTGESGSGKSLIQDALASLFGSKCGTANIRSGKDRYSLQALLQLSPGSPTVDYLHTNGFVFSDNKILISKELLRDGKARIKIGESLASLTHLRELGRTIAEIHTQNEQMILLEKNHQLQYLDRFGNLNHLQMQCASALKDYLYWKEKCLHFATEEANRFRKKAELESNWKELESLSLKPEEESCLLEEERYLSSGEKLAALYQSFLQNFSEGEDSLGKRLSISESTLEKIVHLQPGKDMLLQKFQEAKEILSDIKSEIRNEEEELFFSPERLDMVQSRLQELQKAKKKYGKSVPELLDAYSEWKQEWENLQWETQNPLPAEEEKTKAFQKLKSLAFELSKARRNCLLSFEEEMQKEMTELGLEGSKLQVVLRWEENPEGEVSEGAKTYYINEMGLDQVEFYFTANLGEKPRPLRKVASGGELSRVMLALRSVLGKQSPAPKVLILDEIDTGLGGEAGVHLGKKLRKLSRNSQILLVTHTQQVASQGEQHFRVEKTIQEGRTVSLVRELNPEERKQELARMIGGKTYTQSAFLAASDLLDRKAG